MPATIEKTKKPKLTYEQLAKQQADEHATKVRRITRQLQLERAALLPEHHEIVDRLAELVREHNHSRPLETIRGDRIAAAAELLRQLPQTRGVQAALTTVGVRHTI